MGKTGLVLVVVQGAPTLSGRTLIDMVMCLAVIQFNCKGFECGAVIVQNTYVDLDSWEKSTNRCSLMVRSVDKKDREYLDMTT